MIVPTIHNNGTSKSELIRQISEANTALNAAIQKLIEAAPNSRDYYLTENFREAREDHRARYTALVQVQAQIMEIGEAIADQ